MTTVTRATIRFLIILLVMFVPGSLRAQTIAGRVLDVTGGAPVSGAEIRLFGSGDRTLGNAITDSAGGFRLRAVAGKASLSVRHVAYSAYTSEQIEVRSGQTVIVEIRVGRDVIPLQPLVVTARTSTSDRLAGFRERVALNAFGKFVTREEIDRRPNSEVSHLLANVPSLRIIPVKRTNNRSGLDTNLIMMRGGGNEAAPEGADPSMAGMCTPSFYLDGTRVAQSAHSPIDDLIRSQTLEGIEVYTSFASVPIEYQTVGDCGAVLMWTRQDPAKAKGSWIRNAIGAAALGVIVLLTL